MPLNCSVFCIKNNPAEIIANIKSGTEYSFNINEEENTWISIEIKTSDATMIITRLDSDTAVGEFDDLVDSTLLLAESIDCDHSENKAELLHALHGCTQILGITIEPDFDEICEELLFSLVDICQGVVFTGNLFLNVQGGLVLDIEGNSEEGLGAS